MNDDDRYRSIAQAGLADLEAARRAREAGALSTIGADDPWARQVPFQSQDLGALPDPQSVVRDLPPGAITPEHGATVIHEGSYTPASGLDSLYGPPQRLLQRDDLLADNRRSDLAIGMGNLVPGASSVDGPITLTDATIPQRQTELGGVAPAKISLEKTISRNHPLSAMAIDRKYAGSDANVDLSGMRAPMPSVDLEERTVGAPPASAAAPGMGGGGSYLAMMRSRVSHDPNIYGAMNDEQRARRTEARIDTNLPRQEQVDIQANDARDVSDIISGGTRDESGNYVQGSAADHPGSLVDERERYDQMKAQDAKNQDARARAIDTYRSAAERASNMTIEPNEIWEGMNAGQKFSATVGLVMGAMLSARTGQANPAERIIKDATDRNIDAQREKIKRADGLVKDTGTLYGMLRDQGVDDRTATKATHDAASRYILSRVGARISQSQDPLIRAKFKEFLGTQNQAETDAQITDEMQIKRGIHNAEAAVTWGGGGVKTKPIEQDRLVRLPPTAGHPEGQWVFARSDKSAEKLRTNAALIGDIRAGFDEAKALREKSGWWLPNSKEIRRIGQIQAYIAPKISVLGDNSVLRDAERENMYDTVLNLASRVPGTDENMAKQRDTIDSTWKRQVHAENAEEVLPGYKVANGRIVPDAEWAGNKVLQKPVEMPSGSKEVK